MSIIYDLRLPRDEKLGGKHVAQLPDLTQAELDLLRALAKNVLDLCDRSLSWGAVFLKPRGAIIPDIERADAIKLHRPMLRKLAGLPS